MKANELRIGNYVSCGGEIVRVTATNIKSAGIKCETLLADHK